MLSDEGMAFFLEAPRAVDRRYLRPAARVDLSLAVLDLALAGETGTRDRQAAAACNNLGADNLVVGDLDGAGGAFDPGAEVCPEIDDGAAGIGAGQRATWASRSMGSVTSERLGVILRVRKPHSRRRSNCVAGWCARSLTWHRPDVS